MPEEQLTNNESTAEIIKRINAIEKVVATIPNEERIAQIVDETLVTFFTVKGTTVKSFLITTAVVIGAITVILGGLKAILGWLGFSYIIK